MGLNRGPSWPSAMVVFSHNLDSEMVIHIDTVLLKFSDDAKFERERERQENIGPSSIGFTKSNRK